MTWTTFKPEIVVSTETEDDECSDCGDTLEINVVDTAGNLDDDNETTEAESQHLWKDLEHNLAALFLKMQTVLHVPEKSVQEVIQQLCFYESFSVDKFCRFCMASRSEAQQKEMASSTTMRVILTEADVRKLKLTSRPSSVADLIMYIKDSLGLEYDFNLQFRDPEFDNELCNLTDLSELPEKPTVKIIPVLHLVSLPSSLSENLNDTVSTADTELLSISSTEARKPWPDDFLIPKFSVDVEYRLRQGNLTYLKEGTYLKQLVDEMKKKNPDGTLINQKMDVTLSLRRKEVVQDKPPVIQMLQRWPALFVENQVYQEFNRVVGKNLKQEFYDSLDRHCPALVDVMKSKRGLKRQLLDALLRQAQTSDIADMRCLVLRGLAVLLDDDPSEFFKDCFSETVTEFQMDTQAVTE
ncbi:hypothetical protein MHYP_G00024570 [Metynnis hypsauchen]